MTRLEGADPEQGSHLSFVSACIFACEHAEEEPIFDAADVMRFGKDIFVHMGFTTNNSGFEWLRRHSAARGLRAHQVRWYRWASPGVLVKRGTRAHDELMESPPS